MTEAADKNGSCLCGAISFATSNFSEKVYGCHCSMRRGVAYFWWWLLFIVWLAAVARKLYQLGWSRQAITIRWTEVAEPDGFEMKFNSRDSVIADVGRN